MLYFLIWHQVYAFSRKLKERKKKEVKLTTQLTCAQWHYNILYLIMLCYRFAMVFVYVSYYTFTLVIIWTVF